MKALFFVLAAACFLASLGGGGFYFVGIREKVEWIQDAERQIPGLESEIKRLGDAPSSVDEPERRKQDYALEDALRRLQQAFENVALGRRYLGEWQLAFVGAALGPLLLGGLFLFLGLRARRAEQTQPEALRGAPPGAPGTHKALWPLPLGVVVAGGVLVAVLVRTSSGSGATSDSSAPAPPPARGGPGPTATGSTSSPTPNFAPEGRPSASADPVAPPTRPGGPAKPPQPPGPGSPRSPSVPTSKAPAADPFE